jgi:hypothetical protein
MRRIALVAFLALAACGSEADCPWSEDYSFVLSESRPNEVIVTERTCGAQVCRWQHTYDAATETWLHPVEPYSCRAVTGFAWTPCAARCAL